MRRGVNGTWRTAVLAGGWPALAALAMLGALVVVFCVLQSHPTASRAGDAPVPASTLRAHATPQQLELDQRFSRGTALLAARQYEAAASAWHGVLALAPRMPQAHVNMGFALLGLNRFAVARDFFDAAINLKPSQLNAYFGLALALEGLGDLPGALGAMRTYIHLSPSEDAHLIRARTDVLRWEAHLRQAAGTARSDRSTRSFPNSEKSAARGTQ